MKNKLIIYWVMISFILVSNLTFPQSTTDWGDGELYIGTYYGEGIPDEGFRFYYRMFKVENSTVWDGGIYSSQQVGIDIDNSHTYVYAPKNPDEYVDENTNWVFISDWNERMRIIESGNDWDAFGYGIYKFFVKVTNKGGDPLPNDAYFYIDYRDYNYGNYNDCNGHCNDTWVFYNKEEDKFFYTVDPEVPKLGPEASGWNPLTDGQLLFHYEIKGQPTPSTSEFPEYWQNCLALIEKNNHPRLVWGPHPSENADEYKVYRGELVQLPKPHYEYEVIATVGDSTFEYVDTETDLSGSAPTV